MGKELPGMQGRASDYVNGYLSQLSMASSVERRHITLGADGKRRTSHRNGGRGTLKRARHVLLVVVSGIDAASAAGVHGKGK